MMILRKTQIRAATLRFWDKVDKLVPRIFALFTNSNNGKPKTSPPVSHKWDASFNTRKILLILRSNAQADGAVKPTTKPASKKAKIEPEIQRQLNMTGVRNRVGPLRFFPLTSEMLQ